MNIPVMLNLELPDETDSEEKEDIRDPRFEQANKLAPIPKPANMLHRQERKSQTQIVCYEAKKLNKDSPATRSRSQNRYTNQIMPV